MQLQRLAGNAAVSSALALRTTTPNTVSRTGAVQRFLEGAETTAHASVDRLEPTAPAEAFELGGLRIATYVDAASALRLWCSELADEGAALAQGKVAVPAELSTVRDRGLAHAKLLEGGQEEPLDRGNADDMRRWHGEYLTAVHAGRRAQAFEAATRAKAAAEELRETTAKLEGLDPVLRDVQRARFRAGDEDGLLATADAIATVLDTVLVAKNATEQMLEFSSELRQFAGMPSPSIAAISEKVTKCLQILEWLNKAWAAFQLARVAVDLVSGSKTEIEDAHKGVAGMATLVSAGGTLLNASAGFTLYSNLYIGPMTSACLKMLAKIEDMISKSSNRAWIELGKFDMVNWSLEPGGRKMFDFTLSLMLAENPSAVRKPLGQVDEYLVSNKDAFSAGVGKDGGDLPTKGWWFWEETDSHKFQLWAFKNRVNLWGMLYGAAKVPTGHTAF